MKKSIEDLVDSTQKGQDKKNQVPDEELPPPDDVYNSMPVDPADPDAFGKSVKIEYYKLGK